MRKLGAFAALLIVVAGLAFGATRLLIQPAGADQADTTVLGDLISRLLSTPGSRVHVGAVDGALSSDATIRDVTIADRDGVWLRLDKARLVWSRLALLKGELNVDTLEIGNLAILRRPTPSADAAAPPAGDKEPLLPQLPVRVDVKAFALAELALGEPVLGQAVRLSAQGKAKLGPPAEGLDASFATKRLDRAGAIDLSLAFVPKTEQLTVGLKVAEPQGGLIAHVAGLPGEPPVDLDLKGEGPLDSFKARLGFVAGPTIGAKGDLTLTREGPGRRLAFDLASHVDGLLPGLAAPIFAGETRAQGSLLLKDGGGFAIDRLGLESPVARLDVAGSVGADKVAALTVTGRALPRENGAPKGDVSLGKFVFDVKIDGKLDAPTVRASLDAAQARAPQGALAAATLEASVKPVPAADSAQRPSFAVEARAALTGLAPADPALAAALAGETRLDFSATIDREGVADVKTFALAAPAAQAQFSGRLGAKEAAGRLDLAAPDLSRFAALAGLKLKGALKGGADLSGDPSTRLEARTALKATGFATGLPALDRLLGADVSLEGGLAKLPGGVAFSDLRLAGASLSARLDGQADARAAQVDVSAALADLHRFDARLTGRADFTATLTGALDAPALDAVLAIPQGTALGRPLADLKLTLAGTNLRAAPALDAKLSGDVGGKPAKGALKASRAGEALRLDGLDLAVGSATIKGALALQDGLAQGALAIRAGDLADMAPLALAPLAGDLDATVDLSRDGGQSAKVKATSKRLRLDRIALENLAADLAASDLLGKPALIGTASLARAVDGGKELASNLRFVAKPDGALTLTGRAQGFDLDAAGRLSATAKGGRLDLTRFNARKGRGGLALAQPGAVTFGEGVALERVALALGTGRLTLDGRVSPALDLAAKASAVPLSVADMAAPGLGLAGTLDADARLTGTPAAPQGDWRFAIKGLSAPALRANGLPALTLDAKGRLEETRTSLDASLAGPRIGPLRASGSAPLSAAGALDLHVVGALDLGLVNGKIGAEGRHVSGALDIDARVSGVASKPQIQGGANLKGVAFTDADTGLKLTDLGGRIVGGLDALRLEGVSGKTPNGGSLAVSGKIGLTGGMPADIRVVAKGAQLMNSQIATAVADADVSVTGPLANGPQVGGRVAFSRLDVTIPERLPSSSRPLANVRHIHASKKVAARLKAKAKAEKAAKKGAPDIRLDLKISAPSRVFVRGRGVDAELGGELTIRGAAANPTVIGGFSLRRGRLALAGRRMDFTRGKVSFSGTLEPQLDFLATQQASDALLEASLTGSAAEPDFKFFSEPDLPQDEILARLLFGKSSGGLSATQAMQIALVAAQFAGSGSDGALDKMRRQLGVDSLDVGLGADGGVGVGVNRAINDRVSVGAKAGAKPADTGVSVDVDLSRRLRLQGEATADGNTGVGLGFEMEY